MKKIAKFMALAMASVSVFSMAACGSLGDKYGNEGSANQTIELITNENATKTIVFSYLAAGFGEDPYVAVANEYMKKNPDVQITTFSSSEIDGLLHTVMVPNSSEGLSDIYSYRGDGSLKTWSKQGLVEPLDELMATKTADGVTVRESMTEAAAASITVGDSIYGIPEYNNVTGFIYNASLFEQYGWQVPQTTKELEDLCNKINADTNGTVDPIIWCKDADGYLYFASENWISQYEGLANMEKFYEMKSAEVYGTKDGVDGCIYTSKKLALDNVVKFLLPENEWCYDGSRSIYFMDAQRKILKGEAAMMLNGSWFENEMYKELSSDKYADVKIGMFPVPQLSDNNGLVLHGDGYTTEDNKRVLTTSFGSYYFIPSNAPNKEEAKDFLLYLCSKEACEVYTQYSNAVRPFNYDYGVNTEVYAKVNDFGKSVLKMASENYLYAPIYNSPLGILDRGKLWAKGGRIESLAVAEANSRDSVENLLLSEYNMAKSAWDSWLAQLQ